MGTDKDWWDIAGVIGAWAAVLATILVPLVIYRFGRLKAEAADPEFRERLIAQHRCSDAQGYYLTLDGLLNWIGKFFGPAFGWRAFARCLAIAIVYQFAAALLAWALFNQAVPGGLQLFEEVSTHWQRFLRAIAIWGCYASLIWTFTNTTRWTERAETLVQNSARGYRSGIIRYSTNAIVFVVRFSDVLILVVSIVIFELVGGRLAFFLLIGTLLATLPSIFGGLSIAVGGVIATAASFIGEFEILGTLAFFYFLLPFTNALADWLSLAVTRALLADMFRRRPGHLGLAMHLLVDVVCAVVFFGLLLALIASGLSIWEMVSPATLPLDWRAYWANALVNPTEGMALWIMAFTTFLPTLVHSVFALTLWKAQKAASTREAVMRMESLTEAPSEAARYEIAGLIMRGRIEGFLRGSLYWGLPFLTLVWLMWQGMGWFG